ncbi:hypothetical protein DF035_10690 [Burkholderia contaminans]|nr:hypothetical protein DF035_10690 [Burkholderia contaminans]TCW67658.1 hypothetical protein C5O79_21540 [Burkholderia sp. SRS-25]
MFWGPGCNARLPRVGNLPRAGHVARLRSVATPLSAGRSPRLRLRRAFHRERGEWIVGSQYPCSKRNIGTML